MPAASRAFLILDELSMRHRVYRFGDVSFQCKNNLEPAGLKIVNQPWPHADGQKHVAVTDCFHQSVMRMPSTVVLSVCTIVRAMSAMFFRMVCG